MKNLKVEARITGATASGKIISIDLSKKVSSSDASSNNQIELETILNQPLIWSAELPHLYDLQLTLKSDKNEILESIHWPIWCAKD